MKSVRSVKFIIAAISLLVIIGYGYSMLTASEQTEEAYEYLKGKGSMDYYIFIELLERLDYNISEWKNSESLPRDGVLVLLKPSSEYKIRKKAKLLDWVEEGNILAITGMSEGLELLTGFEMVPIPVNLETELWDVDNLPLYPRNTLKYRSGVAFADSEEVVRYASNSYGVLSGGRKEGEGEIILFSDITIFANMKLDNGVTAVGSYDLAEFINAVFSRYHDREIYYAGVRGTAVVKAEGNPIAILFKGRLKFITIHVLLLILFYFLAIGIRFGPPDLPTVDEQRFLKRHLKGLGGFFEKMHAGFFVYEIYRKYYRNQLLEFYSLPNNVPNSRLIRHIEKAAPDKTEDALRFFSTEKLSISEIMYLRNQMHIMIKEIRTKGRKDGI